MCTESRLVNVTFLNSDLVVPGTEVQFGEVTRPMKFVQELVNDRDRIFVFDCDVVKGAVIHAKPPHSICLLNE